MRYPEPLNRLIEAFLILPGIGRRTAARFAYALLRADRQETQKLITALKSLHDTLSQCERCARFSESPQCSLCADATRDPELLCVVADDRTLAALEQTGQFTGYYFVLGGVLDPLHGVTADTLRIEGLLRRAREHSVSEILLAFDTDTPGETTTLFLQHTLAPLKITVSRLARGLAANAQLEYADAVTLSSAISGRAKLQQNDPVKGS